MQLPSYLSVCVVVFALTLIISEMRKPKGDDSKDDWYMGFFFLIIFRTISVEGCRDRMVVGFISSYANNVSPLKL